MWAKCARNETKFNACHNCHILATIRSSEDHKLIYYWWIFHLYSSGLLFLTSKRVSDSAVTDIVHQNFQKYAILDKNSLAVFWEGTRPLFPTRLDSLPNLRAKLRLWVRISWLRLCSDRCRRYRAGDLSAGQCGRPSVHTDKHVCAVPSRVMRVSRTLLYAAPLTH